MAVDNRTLGRFDLVGIPPAPRGVPQIEVTFDIDANGIVNVSAKDKATGKEQKIRIESSSGLSESEVEKMVNDAKSHAEEDKKKKELIDLRNQGDQLIYTTEKTLKEHGDKVSEEEKKNIEDGIEKLKSSLQTDQAEIIKQKMDDLMQASHKLAEQMYQQAQTQGQAEDQAGAGEEETKSEESKEGTVDADFEVVDDDKK